MILNFLLALIRNATFIIFDENDCDCYVIVSFFFFQLIDFFFQFGIVFDAFRKLLLHSIKNDEKFKCKIKKNISTFLNFMFFFSHIQHDCLIDLLIDLNFFLMLIRCFFDVCEITIFISSFFLSFKIALNALFLIVRFLISFRRCFLTSRMIIE